jgi:hypothetical protein
VAQNEALRIATGCHSITAIDHLHHETSVLPLRCHAELLTTQYLLACHRPVHPCHHHIVDPEPPRNMKKSNWSYRRDIAHITDNGSITDLQYRAGLRTLHTDAVTSSIASYAPNRVLGTRAPPVARSERSLPRRARTTLAQLRSGFCKLLNSYKCRISNGAIADVCPACGAVPHDVAHLFECRTNPTHLTTGDLWHNPVDVARFLDLDPDPDPFDD